MNSIIFTNSFRFLGLVLIQGFILSNVGANWERFPYFNVLIYPLFIILLPLKTPRALQILLGFVLGISIDIFYNSLGIHASAAVFLAFIRPFVLKYLEPRGGYNVNYSPTKRRMGLPWFLRYASILLFAHIFYYFFVEAFTPVYMVDILLKTFFSFIVSMIIITMLQFLFNPVD